MLPGWYGHVRREVTMTFGRFDKRIFITIMLAALVGCQSQPDSPVTGASDPGAALAGRVFQADFNGRSGQIAFAQFGGLVATWDSGSREKGSWWREEGEICISLSRVGKDCGSLGRIDELLALVRSDGTFVATLEVTS